MPDNHRLDLNDLLLFLQVVERGGFSAVSRALGIPKSTISQRISALEAAAGTGLLRRTSRSQSLTQAGELLLPHARLIEREARAAQHDLLSIGAGLSGTLRISCSVAITQFAVGPIIAKFLINNPKVNIRIDATNRYVDLVSEGYDLVVRAHVNELKDSGLQQQVLVHTPWVISAAPKWVDANRVFTSPADLSVAPSLFFRTAETEQAWTLTKDGIEHRIKLAPRFSSDDMAALMMAAIGGAGVVALPIYICGRAIAAGQLIPILQDWEILVSTITAITPPQPQSSRLTKAFTDYLAAELGTYIESWRG